MRISKFLVVTFAIVSIFLIVSCDFNSDLFKGLEGNPFLKNEYDLGDLKTLVIVTDVHIGRDGRDSNIKRYDDKFETFLSKTSNETTYSALVSLGDLIDDSNDDKAKVLDFIKRFTPYCSNKFISVIGNHETHVYSMNDWETVFSTDFSEVKGIKAYLNRMAVYKFENVSVYVMNNADRLFGYTQLDYLEQAMSQDSNSIKIVLAHENIMTGDKLDQSLIVFGNPSPTEMARFAKILEDNGASLVLTGHTHSGNSIYQYGKNCYEMNLASYHAREALLNFEGKGNWYTLSIDETSREIVVKTYLAPTGSLTEETRFKY